MLRETVALQEGFREGLAAGVDAVMVAVVFVCPDGIREREGPGYALLAT